MSRGVFFSIDGVDGAGKSTQLQLFADWLNRGGREVVQCRDPGSTRLGEAIRGILLDRHDMPIGRRSEMLLYMAARAQLVDEIIQPALQRGATILSDRYLLANVVYQAHAGGLPIAQTWEVGRVATGGIEPDLTFVLDLSVDVAWSRLAREPDRMESQGKRYLELVREGFLAEARSRPQHIVIIDADRTVEAVQRDIRAAAEGFLHSRVEKPA